MKIERERRGLTCPSQDTVAASRIPRRVKLGRDSLSRLTSSLAPLGQKQQESTKQDTQERTAACSLLGCLFAITCYVPIASCFVIGNGKTGLYPPESVPFKKVVVVHSLARKTLHSSLNELGQLGCDIRSRTDVVYMK